MKTALLTMFMITTACLHTHGQVVGSSAYIRGNYVEIGLDTIRGFEGAGNTSSAPAGYHPRPGSSGSDVFSIVANPAMDGWITYNGDYFAPGSPENGFGLHMTNSALSNVMISNNADATYEIPGVDFAYWTGAIEQTAQWAGRSSNSGIDVGLTVHYDIYQADLFYTKTITVTNYDSLAIDTLYYYHNMDPDNNQSLSGDYETENTILSQPTGAPGSMAKVKAVSIAPHYAVIALQGNGPNFRVSYGGFSNRNGKEIWNGTGALTGTVGTNPAGYADDAISIAYRLLNLAPGASHTFTYKVILDSAAAETINAVNELPNGAGHTLSLYPNPAANLLNIVPEGAYQTVQVSIVNTLGEVVLSTQLQGGNTVVNIAGLAKGTYMVRAMYNNKVYTAPFVKQ